MRKLLALIVTLAVVLAVLGVGDVVARHRVEHLIAQRIDQKVPGARAAVVISSFPFVGRVAASGTVPKMTADVTGVSAGGVAFEDINVEVDQLKLDRSQLLHGRVTVRGIGEAIVHATITQAALSHAVGLSLTLGAGTIGIGGFGAIAAHLQIQGDRVTVSLASLAGFSFTLPQLSLLPCLGQPTVEPGRIEVSCTTTTIPAALLQTITS